MMDWGTALGLAMWYAIWVTIGVALGLLIAWITGVPLLALVGLASGTIGSCFLTLWLLDKLNV